jgi:2-hydroxy-6-oxonona-2,4-dienedioate hydrolase
MQYQLKEEGEFHYIEQGEGPALVILHGLFGALSNFKDVFDEFSGRFKVVIPMMPIYTLPVRETDVKNLAEYIHRFVNHKGFDKVSLLGNSLGGHVALVYTVAHQERVDKLILTGSSGLYENAMGGSFPRREDRNYMKEKVGYTFYDPAMATDELVDEVFEIVNDREKLIRILALAKSAIRHNMGEELHTIKVETCLIWGKNDNITPPDVADEFHKLIEHSDLYWIDQCGHAPMMEQPAEFNRILSAWFEKVYATN